MSQSILAALATHPLPAAEVAAVNSALTSARPGRKGWQLRVAQAALAAHRASAAEAERLRCEEAAEAYDLRQRGLAALVAEAGDSPALARALRARNVRLDLEPKEVEQELLNLPVQDPGPGFWDRSHDLRTEQWTPCGKGEEHKFFSFRERDYRVRTDAPDNCPSGPCGEKITIHRIR